MKKVLVPLLIFTLVFVLPAVSWYYLQRGLTWRRAAMGELQNFGNISDTSLSKKSGGTYFFKEYKGSSYVVAQLNCNGDMEIKRTKDLIAQFAERPDVRFVLSGDCTDQFEDESFIIKANCSEDPAFCQQVKQKFFSKAEADMNIAYIDGYGEIRRYYDGAQLDEWRKLVEHVSMMLPDERKQYGKENQ